MERIYKRLLDSPTLWENDAALNKSIQTSSNVSRFRFLEKPIYRLLMEYMDEHPSYKSELYEEIERILKDSRKTIHTKKVATYGFIESAEKLRKKNIQGMEHKFLDFLREKTEEPLRFLYDVQFISCKIYDSINELHYKKSFEYLYKGNRIHLNFYYSMRDASNIKIVCENICYIIRSFVDLYDIHGRYLMIHLFFGDLKKQIDDYTWITNDIGRSDVNTAFTYFTNPTQVVLYRKEEMYKVFIHELIHAFDIDFREQGLDFFQKKFGINPYYIKGNLFESYTETLATAYYTLICMKPNSNKGLNRRLYKNRMNRQLDTVCRSLIRILKFKGFKSWEQFIKRAGVYQEDTNILSYYLIKTILLYSFGSFDRFIYESTVNGKISQSNRNIDSKGLSRYIYLIEANMRNGAIEYIKNHKEWRDEILNTKGHSLRLTVEYCGLYDSMMGIMFEKI